MLPPNIKTFEALSVQSTWAEWILGKTFDRPESRQRNVEEEEEQTGHPIQRHPEGIKRKRRQSGPTAENFKDNSTLSGVVSKSD